MRQMICINCCYFTVDPRFKLLWYKSEKKKQKMLKMLSDFVATNYPLADQDVPQPSVGESTNSKASTPKRRKVIFLFFHS